MWVSERVFCSVKSTILIMYRCLAFYMFMDRSSCPSCMIISTEKEKKQTQNTGAPVFSHKNKQPLGRTHCDDHNGHLHSSPQLAQQSNNSELSKLLLSSVGIKFLKTGKVFIKSPKSKFTVVWYWSIYFKMRSILALM